MVDLSHNTADMQKEINILTQITSAAKWRNWLEKNQDTNQVIWLKMRRKNANSPGLLYEEAIAEALCFGWIDSTKRSWDEEFSIQSFTKRKSKSVWSGINKKKIAQLIKEGRMTNAGLASIKVAKANGYWTILDNVEKLLIPEDLQLAFNSCPEGEDYFLSLSNSKKKMLLAWIAMAQRQETKLQRIGIIIENGREGRMPRQVQ